ncbi:MAG TPA: N-acetyltransferase [Gemmataceae bacterium]|nr:N-acetyltransferase [Gemmataceae bacterium]
METSPIADLNTRRLSEADAEPLGRFFELLAADAETTRFFHPHPLSQVFAADLCARQRRCRDRYFITQYHGETVGYSMLRGWDEGYTTPSFGACTHPQLRGAGLGQLLLAHAIAESQAAGAQHLRLTVYKENVAAFHIYRKFGFVFKDKNEHEWIGLLDLRRPLPAHPIHANLTKLDAWRKRQLAPAA